MKQENSPDEPIAVVVLTTWPADRDPAPLASALVEERLAACVSVLAEMDSTYAWQGRVEHQRERQLLIKTTRRRLDDLVRRVESLHPYEVPELLVVDVAGASASYLAWLGSSTDSAVGGAQS